MEELTKLINRAISYGLENEVLDSFVDNLKQQIIDNKHKLVEHYDYSRAIEYAQIEWDIMNTPDEPDFDWLSEVDRGR